MLQLVVYFVEHVFTTLFYTQDQIFLIFWSSRLLILQPGFPQFDNPSFLCNNLITSDAIGYAMVAMQKIVI